MSADIEYRHLESDQDYEACMVLQAETWGRDFNELVPPTILKICQKMTGVAAGAFRGGSMLGFVYGLSGARGGRPAHWSHMLAVTRDARGLGLGKGLKFFQRDYLLANGVEVMFWTYDPLVARNANLNLNRLGALPVEYVLDMYGESTGSDLHSDLGTDRFIVSWEFASTRVARILESPTRSWPLPEDGDRLINSGLEDGLPRATSPSLPRDGAIWIEVPVRIDALKRANVREAKEWRRSSREALTQAMQTGWSVCGLARDQPRERCYYYLKTPAPGDCSTEPWAPRDSEGRDRG